ncbi:thioredoxin [bacterium]|nr:thioredoxin [bacterium]
MQHISETDFTAKVEQASKPVLVDFSAEWCPPCKMLGPVVERLSLEFADQLDVFGVDVDENPGLSQKFNISGVPTMIFFRDGKEVKKLVGFRDYDTLKKEVQGVI